MAESSVESLYRFTNQRGSRVKDGCGSRCDFQGERLSLRYLAANLTGEYRLGPCLKHLGWANTTQCWTLLCLHFVSGVAFPSISSHYHWKPTSGGTPSTKPCAIRSYSFTVSAILVFLPRWSLFVVFGICSAFCFISIPFAIEELKAAKAAVGSPDLHMLFVSLSPGPWEYQMP